MTAKKQVKKVQVLGFKDSTGMLEDVRKIAKAEDRSVSYILKRAVAREIKERS